MKKVHVITAICLLAILATGCADHVSHTDAATMTPVGFLYGLWHGMILPFAWIASLFSDTAIYAVYNNGGWYDFGFILGIGALGSGASSSNK